MIEERTNDFFLRGDCLPPHLLIGSETLAPKQWGRLPPRLGKEAIDSGNSWLPPSLPHPLDDHRCAQERLEESISNCSGNGPSNTANRMAVRQDTFHQSQRARSRGARIARSP